MKNLFTILALLASSTLFSQTEFAPLGATWTYKDSDGWGSRGLESIQIYTCVAVDTVDGKLVKAIQHVEKSQELVAVQSGGTQYQNRTETLIGIDSIYESNDTVFIKNAIFNKYTPLYVFNVQEGDTVRIPVFDTSNAEFALHYDSTMSIIIDSIRMTNYGGVQLQTFYTTSYNGGFEDIANSVGSILKSNKASSNWTKDVGIIPVRDSTGNLIYEARVAHGGYTRVFGGIGTGLKPSNDKATYLIVFDGFFLTDTITCYADDSISFNLASQDCDSFRYNTPLGINSLSANKNFKVYPNPVTDNNLNIESENRFENGTQLLILDILGKEVLSPINLSNKSGKTIIVSSLHAGVYFLVFEMAGQRYYQKFQKL